MIPTSLQLGWVESPPYFCVATETVRYVATKYIEMPVRSLPQHKFEKYTVGNKDYTTMPEAKTTTKGDYAEYKDKGGGGWDGEEPGRRGRQWRWH